MTPYGLARIQPTPTRSWLAALDTAVSLPWLRWLSCTSRRRLARCNGSQPTPCQKLSELYRDAALVGGVIYSCRNMVAQKAFSTAVSESSRLSITRKAKESDTLSQCHNYLYLFAVLRGFLQKGTVSGGCRGRYISPQRLYAGACLISHGTAAFAEMRVFFYAVACVA